MPAHGRDSGAQGYGGDRRSRAATYAGRYGPGNRFASDSNAEQREERPMTAAPPGRPAGPQPRRELTLLIALGADGAGLVLLAKRQGWAHVTTTAPRPLPASVTTANGQALVPAAGALALAALAGLAAVLATRRILRRIAGAVLAGLGVGIAAAVSGGSAAAGVVAAAAPAVAGSPGGVTGSGIGSTTGGSTAGSGQAGS